MFRFPVQDQGRLLLWKQNSGNIFLDSLTNEELRCRYICAAHFPPSSIHRGIRSRLIGPAVPVHFQCVEVGEGSTNQSHVDAENDVVLSPEVLKVKTPSKFYRKRTRSPSPTDEALVSIESSPTIMAPMGTPTQRMSRKSMFEGPKNRLSRKCLFEGKVDDSPKTKVLKKTASTLLKKNRAQKSQIGRLRAKTKMQKSLKSADFQTEFSKTFAMMQLRKKLSKKEWTNEEKNLCHSLHYKSPATYNFSRQQGVVLAAPSTIRKWLTKSNCLPGLRLDVFKNIQKRFENASIKEKACVLCFDEMSIMSIIEGFEDLRGKRRCNKIAKNGLVFLI